MTGPSIGCTYRVYSLDRGLTLADVPDLYAARQGRKPRRLIVATGTTPPDDVNGVPVVVDDTGKVPAREVWAEVAP